MMEFDAFNKLVDQIMAQGHDDETAARYAGLIGDLPIRDEAGNLLVMEGEKVIARLKPLKMFSHK